MRARRGQLRDSILRLLVDTPANGYQLMTELSEKTFGVWKPSPGATYPCLSQLEDEGLITATTVDGQKVFTLTDAGRVAAAQVADEPWADARRGPDSAGHQQGLFEQFGNLAVTVRFAGQTGTDEQLAAIAQQLDTTRKAILAIMAEQ
jgi:DNA-binding PadR family transcriptional regulator